MEDKPEFKIEAESSAVDNNCEINSVLHIIVDKHEAIEQSVAVIKKGIATQLPASQLTAAVASDLNKEPIKETELEGLSNLLTDSRVKAMIKSVAGSDTDDLIGAAIGAMKSSDSMEEKHQAFANGIKKLHSNFVNPVHQFKPPKNDKTLDLALSLVGLNRVKLNGLRN